MRDSEGHPRREDYRIRAGRGRRVGADPGQPWLVNALAQEIPRPVDNAKVNPILLTDGHVRLVGSVAALVIGKDPEVG